MSLDGRKKAAVLVLALGPDAAARALRCMKPEAVAELARAVAELEQAPLAPDMVATVIDDFRKGLEAQASTIAPTEGALEKLLAVSFGAERGQGLLKELENEKRAENPFQTFTELDAPSLGHLLENELPQVQALVLANVAPELAGAVLALRPEDERVDLVLRMARLEDVPPELSLEVGQALGKASQARAQKQRRPAASKKAAPSRARAVASVLNFLEADERCRGLGDKLREKDAALAQAIEEQTLVFDDLSLLDSRALQKLLGQVDSKTLALALKGTDPAIAEKLLKNLSKRAQETVLEEKELLGPQPLSAVEGAQHDMLGIVRGLIQSGEIKLERGKEAELVQ